MRKNIFYSNDVSRMLILVFILTQANFDSTDTATINYVYSQIPGNLQDCSYQVVNSLSVLNCGMTASFRKFSVFRYETDSKQCSLCTATDMAGYNNGAAGHIWVEQSLQEDQTLDSTTSSSGDTGGLFFAPAIIEAPRDLPK
ncbi:hypothetical protein RRG08_012687 [Elysia crispata]|uniref:Uncharacterized protein n=1 Tax=Elysia crispata TaxID=231223 RepID=A0AAE0YML5_9GAST|nr:hypothetical protein RRG08_012687 [Elysia crispata]